MNAKSFRARALRSAAFAMSALFVVGAPLSACTHSRDIAAPSGQSGKSTEGAAPATGIAPTTTAESGGTGGTAPEGGGHPGEASPMQSTLLGPVLHSAGHLVLLTSGVAGDLGHALPAPVGGVVTSVAYTLGDAGYKVKGLGHYLPIDRALSFADIEAQLGGKAGGVLSIYSIAGLDTLGHGKLLDALASLAIDGHHVGTPLDVLAVASLGPKGKTKLADVLAIVSVDGATKSLGVLSVIQLCDPTKLGLLSVDAVLAANTGASLASLTGRGNTRSGLAGVTILDKSLLSSPISGNSNLVDLTALSHTAPKSAVAGASVLTDGSLAGATLGGKPLATVGGLTSAAGHTTTGLVQGAAGTVGSLTGAVGGAVAPVAGGAGSLLGGVANTAGAVLPPVPGTPNGQGQSGGLLGTVKGLLH